MQEILDNLHVSFSPGGKKIRIQKNIEPVELEVSVAIPLALIVNELVTNSYKHAFNNVEEGLVEISLTENGKTVSLRIKDNGPGYNASKVAESAVGLEIIKGLVQQIDGAMTYRYDSGSLHEISFSKA